MKEEVGLTSKEIKDYSISRAIEALVLKNRSKAPLEFAASKAIADRANTSPRGLYIPPEILTKRTLNTGEPDKGGNLVATEHLGRSFIEVLRSKQVVRQLGATILPDLIGDVSIPKQTKASQLGWNSEDEAAAEASAEFGQLPLTPKTVAAYVNITRRLLKQSTPSIDELILNDFAHGMAAQVDRAALAGTGDDNQPRGILHTAEVPIVEIGANGGAIDWSKVVELEAAVSTNDGIQEKPAYCTNHKVSVAMKTTEKAPNTGRFLWGGNASNMNGYPIAVSSLVPSNQNKGDGTDLSVMYFGSWENLIIGEWGTMDIVIDPSPLISSGKYRVAAFFDVDIGLRHAESFGIIKDISA